MFAPPEIIITSTSAVKHLQCKRLNIKYLCTLKCVHTLFSDTDKKFGLHGVINWK